MADANCLVLIDAYGSVSVSWTSASRTLITDDAYNDPMDSSPWSSGESATLCVKLIGRFSNEAPGGETLLSLLSGVKRSIATLQARCSGRWSCSRARYAPYLRAQHAVLPFQYKRHLRPSPRPVPREAHLRKVATSDLVPEATHSVFTSLYYYILKKINPYSSLTAILLLRSVCRRVGSGESTRSATTPSQQRKVSVLADISHTIKLYISGGRIFL